MLVFGLAYADGRGIRRSELYGPAPASRLTLANTLILIDVERMLNSPIAMKEKWRDKANSAAASQSESLHYPINSQRDMLASMLNFVSDLEKVWDVAFIETITEAWATAVSGQSWRGYLDKVDGQEIAYSPRNAFFVSLKPTILGVSFPANRQDLGRWLRAVKRRDEPQVSDYLRDAVTLAHGNNHIVAAFDFEDLLTSRQVRDRLHSAESIAGKEVDLDVLTKVLTSLKGVTITVEATDRLNGKIQVDLP